jgi:uncharacterized protein (TIGR03067 family)
MWAAPVGVDGVNSPDAAAKSELQQFQGAWQAVSIQHADGKQAAQDEVQSTRLVVKGNEFTLTGKNFSISGTFTIDATKVPKEIDVVLKPQEGRATKLLGIYQVRGSTRTSCFAIPGEERPTQFSSQEGHFGFQWRRE